MVICFNHFVFLIFPMQLKKKITKLQNLLKSRQRASAFDRIHKTVAATFWDFCLSQGLALSGLIASVTLNISSESHLLWGDEGDIYRNVKMRSTVVHTSKPSTGGGSGVQDHSPGPTWATWDSLKGRQGGKDRGMGERRTGEKRELERKAAPSSEKCSVPSGTF